MKIVKSIRQMQAIITALKTKGRRIGFMPTMGFLHAGHISLLLKAKKDCDVTVMSIYVNPLQFGPREDFRKYPRDLNRDIRIAKQAGLDYLFVPKDKNMYPDDYLTNVEVAKISQVLCGKSRPRHFKGVTTVVTKLFNIVLPDFAYFGQKDAQQAVIIKKMIKDLNMPLRIKVLPIVREKDGLAMSSRNKYLTAEERKDACALYRSLQLAKKLVNAGERNPRKIIAAIKKLISQVKSAKIDYIEIVDAQDLTAKHRIEGKILITLAVYFNQTRLIDNMVLKI